MGTPTRKGSKATRAKPRSPVVKTSRAKQPQTNAELRQQLAECLLREKAKDAKLQERDRQLAEALEHQTATSEVLGIHQPLAHGRAASARCNCRERCTGMWR
jgi:hypothetical protein